MKPLLAALALVGALCACDRAPEPPVGVTPEATDRPRPPETETAALEAPEPEAPKAEPAAPALAAPPGKIVFRIEPYGQFEVVTWDEALRQAEPRITAENAEAELNRLRVAILGRRR